MGPKQATFLELVIKAIPAIKDRKGASRAAIAKWIQTNCGKEGGGQFNAALRKALTKGIESGVLKQGNTDQRYRIGELPKPKKKKTPKKKTSSKKKKSSKKRNLRKRKQYPKRKSPQRRRLRQKRRNHLKRKQVQRKRQHQKRKLQKRKHLQRKR